MRKSLRYLRIPFSAVCGIGCLLLIAMWVRSIWYWDELYNPISNKHLIIVESASGRAILDFTESSPGSPWIWHISEPLQGHYWGGSACGILEEANRDQGTIGFAAYANPWHTIYRAPLWFFVLVIAAIGAAPWLRWSKRFGLRTLLILTTIFAIILGFAVYVVKHVPIANPAQINNNVLSPYYGLKR